MTKKKKDFLEVVSDTRFIHILLSILLGFLVGAVFLAVMGLSVGEAYGRLITSVTSLKGFSYVIVYSIPYIVVGLSVAFSFKTGVFNIGAEGQFVVGSMAAAVVGILAGDLPKPVLIPLCFLAAMAAGACWGIIVGFLKTRWGINEVLSMIMFNWIAFYLSNFIAGIPAIHSDGTAEATKNISANASTLLSKDLINSLGLAPTANWGILVAILMTVLVWFVIEKTTLGYELKAVGSNKFAAEYGAAADGHGQPHLRLLQPGGLRLRRHRGGPDRLLQSLRRAGRGHLLRCADVRRQQAESGGCPHPADQRHRRHRGVLHRHLHHLQPHQKSPQSSGTCRIQRCCEGGG